MINMNQPVGDTPLERPGGLVGRPLDRIDGPLKVTGHAPYAAEYRGAGQTSYGFVVTSSIGKGRITDLDTVEAEKAPGVLLVLTHKNAPPQGKASDSTVPQLADDRIIHWGQPIALVVAESFEQARAAAFLVKARYAAETGAYDLASAKASAAKPPNNGATPADTAKGDVEAAFAAAPAKVDVAYSTPPQTHAMMEPHATIAVWEGDHLTLWTTNRTLMLGVKKVTGTLNIPKEKLRMISPYIGGSFGAKRVDADTILAALAAKVLQRPVKVVLTREQVFHATTRRSDTLQRIRLAADRDGTLTALAHETWSENTPGETYFEAAGLAARNIYATPNLMTSHRLATLNLPVSSSMRAPGDAVGLLALECAMDELAAELRIDPVALRIKNEPKVAPTSGRPYSSRTLVPCLEKGVELFGWARRNPAPGQVRDGEWYLGMGMALAIRANPMAHARASAALSPDGILTIKSSHTDVGTGSYTILAQIAGDMLGLPMEKVRVELGDTDFPPAPGSGGSSGTNSAGSAVYDACMGLRDQLLKKTNLTPEGAIFSDGALTSDGQTVRLDSLIGNGLLAQGEAEPGDSRKNYAQQSYGAHFAEVAVNAVTAEIRLRRMLGVFTAGRILNAKTARSQAIGGMTFGIGAALMEDLTIDKRDGTFINNNLAEYHVAVHADVPAIEAVFLPELDDKSSPMKSKGLGELGICGAGAAIANAVYNATGVRIRDYPITLDKVLDGWSKAQQGEQRTSIGSTRAG